MLKVETLFTASLTSVLILNTYSDYQHPNINIPIITDLTGTVKSGGTDFDFEYGTETQVMYSCSITWKGAFYIFGGYPEKTQISVVDNCKLTRVGTLPFELYEGACTNVNNEEFYLCFDGKNPYKCYKGTEPDGSFSSIADSRKSHEYSRIANNQGRLKFSFLLTALSRLDSGDERRRPENNRSQNS